MAKQPEVRYINYYVSGNIAYQPEKTHVNKPRTQLPVMPKQKKQLRTVDMNAVCCVVLAAVLLVALAVSAVQLMRAKDEVAQMQRYVQSLQEENVALEQTYRDSFEQEQIQRIADSLGMIPEAQAKHITMQVQLPVAAKEPTRWESIVLFLKGLFA